LVKIGLLPKKSLPFSEVSGLVNLATIKNAAGRVQVFYEGAGILLFESLAAVASDAKFVAWQC